MSSSSPKRIILLDTHAIIHRAYHALPDFKSSRAEPTGALYGLCNIIASIVRELKPDYIIACYDLPGNTFRHDAYDNYKGTRSKSDDALISQIITSREIIHALSIPMYDAPGFEADDIIGTIAKGLSDKTKYDIIIASGDMDTMQLIEDKHIRVFTMRKGITDTVLVDEDAIMARFGFAPELIQDYKGLRGDTSDNIPGVPGIGEKTAMTLVQNFGTIENMYAVLKSGAYKKEDLKSLKITDRIIRLLLKNEEAALFSKMLGTIRYDAPIDFHMPEKTWQDSFDPKHADTIFKKYEFKNMLLKFSELSAQKKSLPQKSTQIQNDVLHGHVDTKDISEKKIIEHVENIIPWPDEILRESQVMLFILDSEKTNASADTILAWAGTVNPYDAHAMLEQEIKKNKELAWLYTTIDKPLIHIVKEMSQKGIQINKDYLVNLAGRVHKELSHLEQDISQLSPEEFNINSPKQLSHVLFNVLFLPVKGIKKRKDGLYSTDIDTLHLLEDTHPIIRKIIEYRELEKMRSTYIDALPGYIQDDSCIHPEFLITGASTGRFASANPNVQNIPIKSSWGTDIRMAFVAREGYSFVSLDYSQIELRIAALLSQDRALLDVFNSGRDIHSEVAMRVFSVPLNEITKDMRRRAKVINFGVLYGMGSSALAKEMGVSRNEAKAYIDTYFSAFPKLAQYLDSIVTDAQRVGYTKTLFGRRRQVPTIHSNIPFIRAFSQRAAINAPIQGTAADCIRFALVNIDNILITQNKKQHIYPLFQIHDELIFEVKDDLIEEAKKIISSAMENVLTQDVLGSLTSIPLTVDIAVGKQWGNMV